MYVTQIDNIIDQILDQLYLQGLANDDAFKSIVEGKKINFVEYRDKINKFIQQFMESIDIAPIQKLINNKENLLKILDIIKRYVAYYYFLSIAYYYTGTIKDFRNNLIQYSKLQENSTFVIKNFFDTENNYQLITFFKMIKDVANIITMTDLQKKTLNPSDVKEAINFLNNLGRDFVDNYLLMIVRNGEERVEINVHNLIKTVVFREIYRNQEQALVFQILNEIEETENEYTFIDIVVSSDDVVDFDSFRQMFMGDENAEVAARDLLELVNESLRIPPVLTTDAKNNNLLKFGMVTPIVDDFLRYHRDTERLEIEADKKFTMPLVSTSNAKNVQMALLYQQRKKKENTKAQLIVNKLDAIMDLYSDNVKDVPENSKDIKKYFQNPFSYRKAVLHNQLEEVRVFNKIFNQGRKAIEGNEYYLELTQIITHAYFNFKDFQKYGTTLNMTVDQPINLLRYSNIENQNQMSYLEADIHTGTSDNTISLVGLALGPFGEGPIQCVRKENLVDIRKTEISYYKEGNVVTKQTENGYKAFRKIVKHFYINTIKISISEDDKNFYLFHDFGEIRKLNPDIFDKIIYWIYDIDKDEYEMDTYENLKTYNFQDVIKFMNAVIYDDIVKYLRKRLVSLVHQYKDILSQFNMEKLIEWFSVDNLLFLKQEEKRELLINEYLKTMEIVPSKIMHISEADRVEKPEFIQTPVVSVFRIRVDMTNPLLPKEYIKMEVYAKEDKNIITKVESKCQHEIEWNDLNKIKTQNLNRYNSAVIDFIEKFAVETIQLDFICRVCGQVLPLKQYVQDGSFDNNTQRFVTAYIPHDVPLEEVLEYSRYTKTIRFLDALVNRFSLITGTTMFVGTSLGIKQRRKALVKLIIDLILKHNSVNLQKGLSDQVRADFYSKKFNINEDLDDVYFFELDDSIIEFDPSAPTIEIEENRLKFNNILLYFMLTFMTELSGAQIATMNFDKIGNIYTFLKYGPNLFDDLLIKKNITDMETVPITQYPVLCYLIFLISYYMINRSYRLWYYPAATTKTFNPYYQKRIINSIVDLFNSISIDAGGMRDDYVYLLTSSKLYSQLNSTFHNNDIINLLKQRQIRVSGKLAEAAVAPQEEPIPSYSIQNPIQIILPTRKIPTFKISDGIEFAVPDHILYRYTETITDLTNCPYGSYHYWVAKGTEIECLFCAEKGADVGGEMDRSTEAYYYNLNKMASRRCLEGTLHDFVGREGQFVCTICGRKYNEIFTISDVAKVGTALTDPNLNAAQKKEILSIYLDKFKRQIAETYNREDLDILAKNLDKIENENIRAVLEMLAGQKRVENLLEEEQQALITELTTNYRKETGEKLYGQISAMIDRLVDILEPYIGVDVDLNISKYPVYLRDNVYIINHSYDGTPLDEPIILTEKDGRVIFREDHPFFKTDVYYYTDNRTQIDVFYHAITLRLLGYKEKHKDYVTVKRPNAYLIINSSIKNRLLTIGYETKYIDTSGMYDQNIVTTQDPEKTYYLILDSLIRDHTLKTKTVVDKFSSILYKIKNYLPMPEAEEVLLETTKTIDILVAKYAQLLKDVKLGDDDKAFEEWNILRNLFVYEPVDWKETNVQPSSGRFINSDLISYYDISSNLVVYYLVNELVYIIDSNPEKITKTNIAQMYIEIINYIYRLYNTDAYKNSMELKRFEYIMNGSNVMIDMLRRGQGLQQSKELEENLEEAEITTHPDAAEGEEGEADDLKEEAEALDVETDYFAEEDEDYAQEGDIEV